MAWLKSHHRGLPTVFDERTLCFAAATVNALDALNVMTRIRHATGPIRRIHASRTGDFGRVRLDASTYGRDAFGQVVIARDFGEALEHRLTELKQLTRYRPARCIAVTPVTDGMRGVRIAHADGEQALTCTPDRRCRWHT